MRNGRISSPSPRTHKRIIINEKETAMTARKRKLNDEEEPAPINIDLLSDWIDVEAEKLYKWIESTEEVVTIRIKDSDLEWLVPGSEVPDDTPKSDRPALGWTKTKPIDPDDPSTWPAKNTKLPFVMPWARLCDCGKSLHSNYWKRDCLYTNRLGLDGPRPCLGGLLPNGLMPAPATVTIKPPYKI